MGSFDCTYPSNGKLDDGILSLALDNHDAASAREKRQETYATHSCLAWFMTFSLIQAFTSKICECATFVLLVTILLISACIWSVGVSTLVKCHVLYRALNLGISLGMDIIRTG